MEDQSDYNRFKREFYRFLDSIRDVESQLNKAALGGFIALLAIRYKAYSLHHYNDYEAKNILKTAVKDFLFNVLNVDHVDSTVYDVPFDHPALYRFLLQSDYFILEDDCELLMLLDEMFPINNRDGASVTPESIADIMVELLDIKPNQNLFDPAVGTGSFLRSAQNYIMAPFSFTAAEKNKFCLLIVKLKAYLSGQHQYQEIQGSSFAFSSSLPMFDIVLSNPPIGKMPKDEYRYRYFETVDGIVAQDMTLNFIELGLRHLKEGGKAAYLVPLGILFSGGTAEKVRESWIQRKLLSMIITLPAGLLYHTSLKCAIAIFTNQNITKVVRLVNAEDCLESRSTSRKSSYQLDRTSIFARVNSQSNDKNVIDVKFDRLAQQNYILIPNAYFTTEIDNKDFISDHWEKLGDIAEIIQGSSLAKLEEGNTPVVRGRDLRVEKIDKDTLAYKNLDSYFKPLVTCHENDILLQRIGANPAAYHISDNETGLIVEDTVFIIRFKDAKREVVAFICDFLNSDQVSSRMSNARSYSVIATQTKQSIKSLEVPIPDNKTLKLVKNINQLEKALRKEHEKAEEYKRALFNGEGHKITEVVEDALFTFNALEEALKAKDDITYRVRTQYPFPLAYAYRHIYLEKEYAGIYERQMKYGEQLLSFLAAIGICLAQKYCIDNQKIEFSELIKEYKENITRGISPGHLLSTLQKSCRILAKNESVGIAQEFSRIWYRSGGKKETEFAKKARENLVDKLNSFKHHRGPANKHERKFGSNEQSEILKEMLTHIEVCSSWKLLRIDDIEKSWRNEKLEYSASLLKGDHPAFEQITFECDSKLSKDKLYLDYEGAFICLYPLISILYNTETRREEIFTIDKESGNSFSLKSFESGTSVNSVEVRADFEFWANAIQ
jgi:hypothetical protein